MLDNINQKTSTTGLLSFRSKKMNEFDTRFFDELTESDSSGGRLVKATIDNAADITIGTVKLEDGVGASLATVLAASTAPATTDTSIVVAINPGGANVGGFTTLVQSTVVMSAAGAYATGDYMGTTTTPQSFTAAVRKTGGTGVIKSILIADKITDTNVAMELWILDRTFTAPTDNTAWDLSDANQLFVQAIIPIATTGWYASSAGQVYFDGTLAAPIKSNGTTLFYALVARGTTPAFTSLDLTITLGILQD